MNIKNLTQIPKYAIHSKYSHLVCYKLYDNYNKNDKVMRTERIVNLNNIHNGINFIDTQEYDTPWAFGVQMPISCSDFAILDIDIAKQPILFMSDDENMKNKIMTYLDLAAYLIQFDSIEQIDVYISSISLQQTDMRYHIYIKLNNVYDTQSLYKNVNVAQYTCDGHKTSIISRGVNTIRISRKFNYAKIEKKVERFTIPTKILTVTKNKTIEFTSYEKEFNILKANKFQNNKVKFNLRR